jgi:hypothetical protein
MIERRSGFRALAALIVFLAALSIFRSNGSDYVFSYDSAPNSLLTFNLLERHRLDFDSFRGGYLFAYGGGYAFAEAPNGHLTSFFPIGAGLLAAPIFTGFYVHALIDRQPIDLQSPAFEDLRHHYEKEAATLLAALAVALCFLCALEIGNLFQAGIACAAFAAGTEMWTVASQALWQHGPVNVFVLAAIYALLRALRAGGRSALFWLALAGACGGFLYVIRPSALIYTAAAAPVVWRTFGRRSFAALPGVAAGAAPGLAWNFYFFHSFLGGYQTLLGSFFFDPAVNARALGGLLISPNRGAFVFTPLLIFSIAGAVRAARRSDPPARLLTAMAIASALLYASYAFFRAWWGGFTFGPRYVTDAMGIAALLLVYVIPPDPIAWLRERPQRAVAAGAFAFAFLWSACVQAAGANGEERSGWSGVPLSVDVHNERLWSVRDSQIGADAIAAYRKWTAAPLAPGYIAAFSGRVQGVQRLAGGAPLTRIEQAPGARLELRALLQNDGAVDWYGYTTGTFAGQAVVRVRLYSADGGEPVGEQYLFIAGAPKPGETAAAIGTLNVPVKPGDYRAVFDVILERAGRPAPRAPRALTLPLVVS